ncbi:hypothetical protein ACIBHX_43415 [Nonomuraea sp. NPDC050536]|uniref:hypothetical protein n=1 Tax=Nonomuraea sp. NPDC050536 TaxID=3364366 RepID=UPI0037C5ED6B
MHRARSAVTSPSPPPAESAHQDDTEQNGPAQDRLTEVAGGVVVPDFLRHGWAGARPLALRTLQEAYAPRAHPGRTRRLAHR